MEHARVQRIAGRWRDEPVEVEHYVQDSGVLSLGSSAGTLEETDDTGLLLSVQSPEGSVELRSFPWTSVVTIATPLG